MRKEHTPGKWQAQSAERCKPIGISSEHGMHICDVSSYGSKDSTREANAQLIASAPDLLQGLKDAVDWLKELGYGNTPQAQDFKDIISKAQPKG